jgi:hypothetical protein
MWLLDRIGALGSATHGSFSSCRQDANTMRAYARWLNAALSRVAEALLCATPVATNETCHTAAPPHRQLARVRSTCTTLRELLQTAQQYNPPSLDSPENTWAHKQYIDLLERSLVALECLHQGLETADEGTVRVASSELREIATLAADLHGHLIEWALPFLIGPD